MIMVCLSEDFKRELDADYEGARSQYAEERGKWFPDKFKLGLLLGEINAYERFWSQVRFERAE